VGRDLVAGQHRQSFITVDGLNIRYLEAGNNVFENGKGTNTRQHHVLFMHGLGSSADRWLDIPDALSIAGLHTIAMDLPGFGLSDKPEEMDYTIGQFVRLVADFIPQAGMPKDKKSNTNKTTVVGHSLGGYIAAQLAVEHPELVDRLVLIDTSGMLDGPTPLLQQYHDAAMNPTRESVRAIFQQLVADPIRIADILVDGFIYRIAQPGAKRAFKSAFDNSVYNQIGAGRLKQIGGSKIPTLIIWGRHDKLIPLEYSKIFQEAIEGSRIELVEDAGHAPFAEMPAIVYLLLHQFLLQPCSIV
jgi:2-hydroxy-6-oxonona-2,4-dienedioate hydrolase